MLLGRCFVDAVNISSQLTLHTLDSAGAPHPLSCRPKEQKVRFPEEEILPQDYSINFCPGFQPPSLPCEF